MDWTCVVRAKNYDKIQNAFGNKCKDVLCALLFKRVRILGRGSYGVAELVVPKKRFKKESKFVSLENIDLGTQNDLVIKKTKTVNDEIIKYSKAKIDRLFLAQTLSSSHLLNEIIIGQIVSQFVLSGMCQNFSLMYYWDTAPYSNKLYTFTEYYDCKTLSNFSTQTPLEWDSILFQLYFAVLFLNESGIVHGDLHLDNVLLKCVEPGGYWKYVVRDTVYYIPNYGKIPLIHDFGFSWVPGKMKPTQYEHEYITTQGLKYFDVSDFTHTLFKRGMLPRDLQSRLRQAFVEYKELKYIYSSEYYTDEELDDPYNGQHIPQNYVRGETLDVKINKIFGTVLTQPLQGDQIDTFTVY